MPKNHFVWYIEYHVIAQQYIITGNSYDAILNGYYENKKKKDIFPH